MAEYIFADIGLGFKLAFDIDLINKIYHSSEQTFDQAKRESFDLVQIFGGERGKEEIEVIIMLKDGTSFIANNCHLEKSSNKIKIYPLHPSLFEPEQFWTRAVLSKNDEIAFAVVPDGLKKVCNG